MTGAKLNRMNPQIVKLDLMSKNNRQRGSYLYMPIVLIDGEYFRCKSILSQFVLRKEDISLSQVYPTSKITPEYYEANGLK